MSILGDGHGMSITFGSPPSGVTIANIMKEKTVTPMSMEGGGPNDTTTMRNTTYRTRQPKNLITMGNATLVCAYDPQLFQELVDMLNVNQEITFTFPDNATLVVWGWIDAVTPAPCAEGEQPTCEVTIVASNQNDAGEETAPVYSA